MTYPCVSLQSTLQSIPYSTLQAELDIRDLRELEDLIIEAIYAGIIQAKLDQKNAKVCVCVLDFEFLVISFMVQFINMSERFFHMQLEVECFIGRDIKMDSVPIMIQKLESW